MLIIANRNKLLQIRNCFLAQATNITPHCFVVI